MEQIRAYLELHNRLRGTLLFAGFFVASVALYIVIALWLVEIPGARSALNTMRRLWLAESVGPSCSLSR